MINQISFSRGLGVRLLVNRGFHRCSRISAEISTPGKTSILIKSSSPNVNQQSLELALKDLKYKRLQIQPGCSIFFKNLADAEAASNALQNKSGLKSNVVKVSLPSVSIENIPSAQTLNQLINDSSLKNPLNLLVNGADEVAVKAKTYAQVVQIYDKIASLKDVKIGVQEVNGHYSIKLFGVQGNDEILTALQNAGIEVEKTEPKKAVFTRLALKYHESSVKNLAEMLRSVQEFEVVKLPKPVIFLRNIKNWNKTTIDTLLQPFVVERVQLVRGTKDGFLEQAILSFANEQEAKKCYSKLKGLQVDGKQVSVSYKEVSLPGVYIKNLPVDATVHSVQQLLSNITSIDINLIPQESTTEAIVSFGEMKDMELALLSIDGKVVGNNVIKAEEFGLYDLGIKHSVENTDRIQTIMKQSNVEVKGTRSDSGISANLAFETIQDARDALKLVEGKALASEDLLRYNFSTSSAGVVEVETEADSTPSNVLTLLQEQCPQIHPVKTERFALLKLARHKEVVPTMKKLKQIDLEGKKLHVEKYRKITMSESSDYDVDSRDQLALYKASLTHLYDSDIEFSAGKRYRIVRNRFERALNDAKLTKDGRTLLEDHLPAEAVEEATKLLSSGKTSSDEENRLFELYIQRADVLDLSRDFPMLEALFGVADASDPFNWAYLQLDEEQDKQKYTDLFLESVRKERDAAAEVKAAEEAAISSGETKLTEEEIVVSEGSDEGDDLDEDDLPSVDGPSELVITGEDGNEITVSLEDPSRLKDQNGQMWAGAILDTDSVQKTMPGQRVNTSRALVVVGNLRGTAGFGMGKGKTGADAVNSAFRAALRNLTHVDLYDNFGLAHDLHGKHNSCHCYIKATPKSRIMVASPLASAILTRFGISSASVKLVGRRNPYSMVRAIFSALEQHQNIDEYANARGKKYLTLKWARENSV